MFEPQENFPLLEKFKERFPIDSDTVFAYDNKIYTNQDLPEHLVIHEKTHHKQQERDGLEYWVENYLNDPKYRLEQEIEAYRAQIQSIKDRNYKTIVRYKSAKTLSSGLYGGLLTFQEALNRLK